MFTKGLVVSLLHPAEPWTQATEMVEGRRPPRHDNLKFESEDQISDLAEMFDFNLKVFSRRLQPAEKQRGNITD